MPVGRNLTLTDGSILGLFFMQRYRFLTISQFARVADLKKSTASSQLLMLERYGLLSHFGNTGLVGHGKTPKVYFLTRRGHEILLRESDIPPELIGHHKEIHVQSRWSPQMYHRGCSGGTLDFNFFVENGLAEFLKPSQWLRTTYEAPYQR